MYSYCMIFETCEGDECLENRPNLVPILPDIEQLLSDDMGISKIDQYFGN